MPDPLVEHPPGVDPVVSSGTPARPTTKRSQVKLMLAELIDGQLSAGEAIQSERNLVRELGVSRVTVRQAISDLVAEGRLERVHGKGTYVTGPGSTPGCTSPRSPGRCVPAVWNPGPACWTRERWRHPAGRPRVADRHR